MKRSRSRIGRCLFRVVPSVLLGVAANCVAWQLVQAAPPKDQTYMPVVPTKSFEDTYNSDTAEKDAVMSAQRSLLEKRYDLSDNPSDVQMSGKRKAVQQGVRAKLPGGTTWDKLSGMSPDQIKRDNSFPYGFRPLPHVKHPVGGMVFPKRQIDEIKKQEGRDLQRFDVDFDIPDHFT